ncbi:MAG: hypothetical protein R3264_00490 [Anaerolineae bacterium]|nr:hypothetical protein [Anaerolineae bacterium]
MQKPMEEISRLNQLLRAMEQGWEIDEPVLCGAMWSTDTNSPNHNIYHFILRHKGLDKTDVLRLPASPDLLAYVTEHNIPVNHLQIEYPR